MGYDGQININMHCGIFLDAGECMFGESSHKPIFYRNYDRGNQLDQFCGWYGRSFCTCLVGSQRDYYGGGGLD